MRLVSFEPAYQKSRTFESLVTERVKVPQIVDISQDRTTPSDPSIVDSTRRIGQSPREVKCSNNQTRSPTSIFGQILVHFDIAIKLGKHSP